MRLDENLPPTKMHTRLHEARRNEDSRGFEVAFYLRQFEEGGFYVQFGYSSVTHYAEAELAMSTRQVRDRIRVMKALDHLPRTLAVFREGKIWYSAVREITRVATPASEEEWIRAALQHSIRDLERMVKASKGGRVPRKPSPGLPRGLMTVRFKVSPDEMALIEVMCRRHEAETGSESNLRDMFLRLLHREYEGDSSSGPKKDNRGGGTRPELTYIRCRECREGAVSTEEGFVQTTPAVLDAVEARARVRDVTEDVDNDEFVSTPTSAEVPLEERDAPTSSSLRDLVLARDGHCCTIPGCYERSELQAHHVRWRRHGGRTVADNLTTLCLCHHGIVHQGSLIVSGSFSRGLEFSNPDGTTHVGHAVAEVSLKPTLDAELESLLASFEADANTVGDSSSPVKSPRHVLVGLEDIPEEIDTAWWRDHSNLFGWSSQKRALVLTPGIGDPRGSSTEAHGLPSLSSQASLKDLVGHDRAVRALRETVEMTQATSDVSRGILLTGSAGLGKTTLAGAFAQDCGVRFKNVLGSFLDDPTGLLSLLAELDRGDVLFIDEIHAVPQSTLEVLYTAIEGRYVDLLIREGSRTRTVRLKLEPFTLVGATTEEGRIPVPLLTRFEQRLELTPFEDRTMGELLGREVNRKGMDLEIAAKEQIVAACFGTPRTALSLLKRAMRSARSKRLTWVMIGDVQSALDAMDLDENGLCGVQRRILDTLREHRRAMGLAHLATHVGKSTDAILNIYEPDLVRAGYVRRTPMGRVAGASGRQHARVFDAVVA